MGTAWWGDIVVGIIGALGGGFLTSRLGLCGTTGLMSSNEVTLVGALLLIVHLPTVAGRHSPMGAGQSSRRAHSPAAMPLTLSEAPQCL